MNLPGSCCLQSPRRSPDGPLRCRLSEDPLVLAMLQPHHTCGDFLALLAATRLEPSRHPRPFCLLPFSWLGLPVQKPVWGQTSLCEGFCHNFNKEQP